MKLKNLAIGLVATTLLAVSACSMQKTPATQAVAAAETALAAIKDDAAKYVPNDLQSVETSIASLKDNLTKGDYKAVLAAAPGLMTSLDALKTAAAAKMEEVKAATAEWTAYATDLPKMVEAIQSRVDVLSAAKKLPKGLDKAALDTAKSGLETMKATWTEASAAFTGGNALDAVAKAKTIKAKGEEVLTLLGMTTG
jgi:hypothetical protein